LRALDHWHARIVAHESTVVVGPRAALSHTTLGVTAGSSTARVVAVAGDGALADPGVVGRGQRARPWLGRRRWREVGELARERIDRTGVSKTDAKKRANAIVSGPSRRRGRGTRFA
jgi:hypothetical protein